jgi:hypothetical protein
MMEDYINHCGSCFKEIKNKSKIIYNPTEANCFGNMNNIEFDFLSKDNDDANIVFLSSLLNEELLLWNLPTYCRRKRCSTYGDKTGKPVHYAHGKLHR